MPTPNISRITPISAICEASARVGDEAGRVGPDDDAREHVADERRQAEALRHPAEDERDGEPAGERDDDREVVHAGSERVPLYCGARPPRVHDEDETVRSALGADPRDLAPERFRNAHESAAAFSRTSGSRIAPATSALTAPCRSTNWIAAARRSAPVAAAARSSAASRARTAGGARAVVVQRTGGRAASDEPAVERAGGEHADAAARTLGEQLRFRLAVEQRVAPRDHHAIEVRSRRSSAAPSAPG